MKFDTPATTNPIDQLQVVGRPTPRIDGPRKVTGRADQFTLAMSVKPAK